LKIVSFLNIVCEVELYRSMISNLGYDYDVTSELWSHKSE